MYPRFLEAHTRAVEQGTLTPELRCNRAHGLHMFEHRPHEAEGEFLRALADKPAFATVHVRMALMCATLGQLDRALELVTEGYKADPLLPTLPPVEVNVRVWRREYDKAVEIGRKAVELHPYLQISRANYAQALEFSGRLEEALEQYQLGSIMSGDLPWMRALEAPASPSSVVPPRLTPFSTSSSIVVMPTMRTRCTWPSCRDALGERAEAFKEIERAFDENSAFLYSIDVDPKMDTFRDDRRFARLQDSIRIKGCRASTREHRTPRSRAFCCWLGAALALHDGRCVRDSRQERHRGSAVCRGLGAALALPLSKAPAPSQASCRLTVRRSFDAARAKF